MGIWIICIMTFLFMAAPTAVFADEPAAPEAGGGSDIEGLKKRVEELEKRMDEGVKVDEAGHRLHPIHSKYGLKIGGGVTMTAQGAGRLKGDAHQAGAFGLSADLVIESPVGSDGRAVGVLDFQRGAGLTNLPAFFKSPNGNPSGTNADIESYDNDQLHAAEFYYEHNVGESLIVTMGQLNLAGYFDANVYANNERSQFLANCFVNNTAIEFGGSDNFYGPGARVAYTPVKSVSLSAGAFEGDGNYVDTFDSPFTMAEADFKAELRGKVGNYRLYYWNRQGRGAAALGDTANPSDPALEKAANQGVGISLDQGLTEDVGVWLRAGVQRKKVAQSDKSASAGLNVGGALLNRPDDSIGLGYAVSFMGKDYRGYMINANPGFRSTQEHYFELYYNAAVAGAKDGAGLHVTPDIQYVVNPGGDADASRVFVFGMRLQAFF